MRHFLFFLVFQLCFAAVVVRSQNIDSLKIVLKKAEHDTVKLKTLDLLISLGAEDVEEYNEQMRVLAEINLKKNNNPRMERNLIQFLALAKSNGAHFILRKGETEKALAMFQEGLILFEKSADKVGQANALNNIGMVAQQRGDIPKAIEYLNKSLQLRNEIQDKSGLANSYQNIGGLYFKEGNVQKCLEYFHSSLKLNLELGNKKAIANLYHNIGFIHESQGDGNKALESYEKALEIRKALNDQMGIALSLNNIGNHYNLKGDHDKCMEYLKQSLEIREKLGDKHGMLNSYNNIGNVYLARQNTRDAIPYFNKALPLAGIVQDKAMNSALFGSLARAHRIDGNTNEALRFGLSSMKLSQELGYPSSIKQSAETLYWIYRKRNEYVRALEMHEIFIKMRDSLANQETRKASIKKQLQIEYEKKELEVKAIAKAEQEKLQLKAEEDRKRQNLIIYSVVTGLLTVCLFSFFIFRSLQKNKEANRIISAQKKEVEHQKQMVDEKQKEILDSIHYAKRIQTALISSEKYVERSIERLRSKKNH
jgi:tetratricopeptide (TPR) repeat protein